MQPNTGTSGRTGTMTVAGQTFVVNQAGIVYEKDLGPKTPAIVSDMVRFNPDKTWEISQD